MVHGEFLRLLYILAHRRTTKYFASLGDDEPGVDAITWRRSQFFWQHRAAIGLANAVAVARRAHLAHPARPRLRAHPSPLISRPDHNCGAWRSSAGSGKSLQMASKGRGSMVETSTIAKVDE